MYKTQLWSHTATADLAEIATHGEERKVLELGGGSPTARKFRQTAGSISGKNSRQWQKAGEVCKEGAKHII